MANDGGGNGGSDDLSSSLATVKCKVKSFIKSGVASTNGALEETERLVYRPALQSAQTAQKESAAFLRQASSVPEGSCLLCRRRWMSKTSTAQYLQLGPHWTS